jgi:choline kinase
VIVVGHKEGLVRAALDVSPMPVRFVVNPLYAETQTFYSLLLTRTLVEDAPFIKLNGDVIFEEEVLGRLLASPAPCAYAVDERIALDGEAMKVELGADGRVARIGKGLSIATEDTFQRAMNAGVRFDPVCIGGLRWTEIDDDRDLARAIELFGPDRLSQKPSQLAATQ